MVNGDLVRMKFQRYPTIKTELQKLTLEVGHFLPHLFSISSLLIDSDIE